MPWHRRIGRVVFDPNSAGLALHWRRFDLIDAIEGLGWVGCGNPIVGWLPRSLGSGVWACVGIHSGIALLHYFDAGIARHHHPIIMRCLE